MNVNAVYLKDSNDNIVSPVVSTNSIFDTNGNNLNNILATFQAEYGMTFEEWVNSNYSPDTYFIDGTEIRLSSKEYINNAISTDVIQPFITYRVSSGK